MILLCKFHWPKKQLTKFRMLFLSPRSLGASENMVLGHVTGIVKQANMDRKFHLFIIADNFALQSSHFYKAYC